MMSEAGEGESACLPILVFWKHIVVVSKHNKSPLNLANIFFPLTKPTHNTG
jgi:hypothetical protein